MMADEDDEDDDDDDDAADDDEEEEEEDGTDNSDDDGNEDGDDDDGGRGCEPSASANTPEMSAQGALAATTDRPAVRFHESSNGRISSTSERGTSSSDATGELARNTRTLPCR